MAFDDITSPTDAQPTLIREDLEPIFDAVQRRSVALSSFTNVPILTSQGRVPVLSTLPAVGWVSPTGGLIGSTKTVWEDKYLNVEKIAAILPISKDTIADNESGGVLAIIDTMLDKTAEAMALSIDRAVFLGTSAPSNFPDDIVTAATAAGNDFQIATAAADGGISEDQNQALALLDADGFYADYGVASKGLLSLATTLGRDAEGRKDPSVITSRKERRVEIDGLEYGVSDVPLADWGTAAADPIAVALDTSQFVIGMRQELEVSIDYSGSIQDETGAIMYNLLTQDLVALKVTMRMGWQVANTVTPDEATEADRYPAAVLTRPA